MSMSLSTLSEDEFSFGSQERGYDYFKRGAVKLISHSGFLLRFHVRGSSLYWVDLNFKLGIQEMDVSCTCPHFDSGNFCKHIWACFLFIDYNKILPAAASLTELSLIHVLGDGPGDEIVAVPAPRESKSKVTSPAWKSAIQRAQLRESRPGIPVNSSVTSKNAQFAIDLGRTHHEGQIFIQLFAQDFLKKGGFGASKPIAFSHASLALFRQSADQEILKGLLGRLDTQDKYYSRDDSNSGKITDEFAGSVLAQISAAGKLFAVTEPSGYYGSRVPKLAPYRFEAKPWHFELRLNAAGRSYVLTAHFSDGTQSKSLKEHFALTETTVLFADFIALSDGSRFRNWIEVFERRRQLEIPGEEIEHFLELFFADPYSPPLVLPAEIEFKPSVLVPKVRLLISDIASSTLLQCALEFDYGGQKTTPRSRGDEIIDVRNRLRIRRDLAFEKDCREKFHDLGAKDPAVFSWLDIDADGVFDDRGFVPGIEKALALGWEVIAHERKVHAPKDFSMAVASGVDWFDLTAEFTFDEFTLSLPQLIANIRSGERTVRLGSGACALLPEAWLSRFGPIAEMGKITGDGVRLNKVQALFLNASLAENEKLRADRKFRTLQAVTDDFNGLRPASAPSGFRGKLRTYQKKGLAWLRFLSAHDLGGILADDMGLGKTIQILALLAGEKMKRPSLIVAPKSLIFNWVKEAEKFTPGLKVLNFTGHKRADLRADLKNYDIVLTTYQSLRGDVEFLKELEFEYFILDEAHNVKNPKAQATMACRLIRARKKIALTGTPIENSLLDLFSILSIVVPGLLSETQARDWSSEPNQAVLKTLSRALTPFILRRTKEQVLKDLPEKSEQVLYCELSGPEMRKYNELKTYYWGSLSGKIAEKGFARSKIEVLEALLRLRQAACHQGLLGEKFRTEPSAKFELLLEQLDSIIKDGHKALIFSQFTSLLALFRRELEKRQIQYAYLDGQTQDRQQPVQDFQTDPSIKLFLLSLKAGGTGLNLTSADYVFILDPWWNPAAEAQAIDRTHRIGQTKKVLAYRLIAKDTVEEKILELQKSKRELAKTVISDEQGLIKNLKFEDLRQLFM